VFTFQNPASDWDFIRTLRYMKHFYYIANSGFVYNELRKKE